MKRFIKINNLAEKFYCIAQNLSQEPLKISKWQVLYIFDKAFGRKYPIDHYYYEYNDPVPTYSEGYTELSDHSSQHKENNIWGPIMSFKFKDPHKQYQPNESSQIEKIFQQNFPNSITNVSVKPENSDEIWKNNPEYIIKIQFQPDVELTN